MDIWGHQQYQAAVGGVKHTSWWEFGMDRGKLTNNCDGAAADLICTVLHCTVPVVHEDVRGPDVGGGDAQVLDVSVLGLIPPQIVVSPLLWWEHKYFYVSQLFSRPFTQIFFCPNIVFAFAFWITNKTIFKALSLCLYCHHLSTAARKYSNIHNHDILLLVEEILISLFWTLKKCEADWKEKIILENTNNYPR